MSTRWTPTAGDFITIDFDPQAGHEQAARRPALIISEAAYNTAANLAVVCPITSNVKGYPFEVLIPPGNSLKGVVLADYLKSLDLRARRAKLIARSPKIVPDTVREYVAVMLGISYSP